MHSLPEAALLLRQATVLEGYMYTVFTAVNRGIHTCSHTFPPTVNALQRAAPCHQSENVQYMLCV